MQVDFNRRSDEGQMTVEERQLMYQYLVDNDCKYGIESGTWKGGGSTYIIANALIKTQGMLHTYEVNREMQHFAINLYNNELAYLKPYIEFYNEEAGPNMIQNHEKESMDFILLDGHDNSLITLLELASANYLLKEGALIFCHDWTGSSKQWLTKPVLEHEHFYKKLYESSVSTGFAIFRKITRTF